MTSDYISHIIQIKGTDVACVIDNNKPGHLSVTNDIENIAKTLKVDHIIYKDSEGIFDYWDIKKGFKSLSVDKKHTTTLDEAIEVTKGKFF